MSTRPNGSGSVEEWLTPEEAFSLVGNNIRSEILRVLSEAREGEGRLPALSFSEIHSRIDTDIDSSQFNYHLQQLLGNFVESTEARSAQLDPRMAGDTGEGYVLRPEGTILTRTIRARVASEKEVLDPFDTTLDCYFCGTTVKATYANTVFMARCPGCEYMYEYDLAPPGGIDDSRDSVLAQISTYLQRRRLAFANGVCPLCASGLQTAFVSPEEMVYPRADLREVLLNRWCTHCGERSFLRTGEFLLKDPVLIKFCDDHDIDITGSNLWELEFAVTDQDVTVLSTDPWKLGFRLRERSDSYDVMINDDQSLTHN